MVAKTHGTRHECACGHLLQHAPTPLLETSVAWSVPSATYLCQSTLQGSSLVWVSGGVLAGNTEVTGSIGGGMWPKPMRRN